METIELTEDIKNAIETVQLLEEMREHQCKLRGSDRLKWTIEFYHHGDYYPFGYFKYLIDALRTAKAKGWGKLI